MSSPIEQIPGRSSICSISFSSTEKPLRSRPGAEGIVDGAAMYTCNGSPSAAQAKAFSPGSPQTFVISCGSGATVVVPQASATSAKCAGVIMLLSMCM